LQKISDAPLTVCPKCGAASFRKQVTAAGFRLKGAGWYVTDFRGGDAAAAPASADNGDHAGAKTDAKVDGKPSEGGTTPAKSPAAPAKPDAAPAPAADSSH
jgi:predicted nucleic acid-binding Zn ribbon protein